MPPSSPVRAPTAAPSTSALAASCLLIACAPAPPGAPAGDEHPWQPFAASAEPSPGFLCPDALDPHAAADVVHIDCAVEGSAFGPEAPAARDELVVMTWNLERGQRIEEQLAAFADGTLPIPDVLLASEVDRGCERSGGGNVPWQLAEALGMNHAFAVEFVELPRGGGSGGELSETCEHGNAIFSRFPLGNVGQLRHRSQRSWYIPPEDFDGSGEPRLGGRVLVLADIAVGDRLLHLSSLHYESSPKYLDVIEDQALETAEEAEQHGLLALAGGDTNAPAYTFDLAAEADNDQVVGAFLDRGWTDAHAPLEPEDRGTRSGLVIDLLLGTEPVFADPVVADEDVVGHLSDHLPIWATVRLP